MSNDVRISERVTIVVCDPCPLIFAGLQKNFDDDPRIRIVGETPNLRTLCQRVAVEHLDIALVDWTMIAWYDDDCIKMVREISSHTFLVLLGMAETTRDRKRALEFGSRGIISKSSSVYQIRKALGRVAKGGIWLERSAAETMLDHVFSPRSGPQHELQRIELLTRRERQVIELVCRSLRNKEIASALFISESTVWHHLTSIFGKLQITDRVSLVTFAFRHNLSSFFDPPRAARTNGPALLAIRPPNISREEPIPAPAAELTA